MYNVIIILFAACLLSATTCKTKKMNNNRIVVDNLLDKDLSLLPRRIKYDYYDMTFTKERLIHNYSISSSSTGRVFHTPFCMERFWENTVIGDTLEVLVFEKESLASDKSLRELIAEEKFIRTLKITYSQLTDNDCKVTID